MACENASNHWTRFHNQDQVQAAVRSRSRRADLKDIIDQLKDLSRLNSLALDPVIVPRMDKLPVIVRVCPFDGPAHQPGQDVRALLTLKA